MRKNADFAGFNSSRSDLYYEDVCSAACAYQFQFQQVRFIPLSLRLCRFSFQVSIPVGPIYTILNFRGSHAARWFQFQQVRFILEHLKERTRRLSRFNSSRSDLYCTNLARRLSSFRVSIPVGPIYTKLLKYAPHIIYSFNSSRSDLYWQVVSLDCRLTWFQFQQVRFIPPTAPVAISLLPSFNSSRSDLYLAREGRNFFGIKVSIPVGPIYTKLAPLILCTIASFNSSRSDLYAVAADIFAPLYLFQFQQVRFIPPDNWQCCLGNPVSIPVGPIYTPLFRSTNIDAPGFNSSRSDLYWGAQMSRTRWRKFQFQQVRFILRQR